MDNLALKQIIVDVIKKVLYSPEMMEIFGKMLERYNIATNVAVDNLDTSYANPEIAAHTDPENPEFGRVPENRQVLEKRLKRIKEIVTLQEVKGKKELFGKRDKKGNFHRLKGNRDGFLATTLYQGWALIFKPAHEPIPVDENGNLDWSKVTAIELHEIWDYHKDEEWLKWKRENMP